VEDDVTIYVEYPNGATGTFITTTGEAAGTNRLEIDLDKGKIVFEKGEITVTELSGSTREHLFQAEGGFANLQQTTSVVPVSKKPVGQHPMVLNAFAEAIVTGDRTKLFARGEEGINGLTISNAAFLSSWLEQTITLPLDEDLFYAKLQEKIAASQEKGNVQEKIASDITFGTI
jgi:predicted dehydrogenase